MVYKGKNYDPNFKAKQARATIPPADAVTAPKPKRLGIVDAPKPCWIKDNRDGSTQSFPSRKAAAKMLAFLIKGLPPKESPDEPDIYTIVDHL